MKKVIVGFLFLTFNIIFAQENLNEFQYALIPSKFSFQKEKNQYQLNTLSKLFMEKYGFVTYLDSDNLPKDFVDFNCNKVYVDVIANNSLFTTKLTIQLKDCKNNVLFSSPQGTSRDKEYRVAYNEALRMAFNNFEVLKTYKFQPSSKSLGMIGKPAVQESVSKESLVTEVSFSESLFAKPFEHGFQLLTNNTNIPQYVMTIFKTSSPDTFIASKGNIIGILIRKVKGWYFEYYKDNVLVSELISIVNL